MAISTGEKGLSAALTLFLHHNRRQTNPRVTAGTAHRCSPLRDLASRPTVPEGLAEGLPTDLLPMEAEEALSRLMAPGGRTSRTATVSFDVVDAKRISDSVFPKIVANVLRGLRKPVPRTATFLPACVLDSTVGLEDGPGDWNVHQMHVVLPARPGRCRLLFRLSVDFVAVPDLARAIGGEVWANLAQMVLKEQLEGVRASGVDDVERYQEWKVSVSGDFD